MEQTSYGEDYFAARCSWNPLTEKFADSTLGQELGKRATARLAERARPMADPTENDLQQISSSGTEPSIDDPRVVLLRRNAIRRPPQARYWIATIPKDDWTPHLPEGVCWVRGQLERGSTTKYEHWQFVFSLPQKRGLKHVLELFPKRGHYEPTRSKAAEDYVHKQDTRIGEVFFINKAF